MVSEIGPPCLTRSPRMRAENYNAGPDSFQANSWRQEGSGAGKQLLKFRAINATKAINAALSAAHGLIIQA